jgi:hypothetical protein
MNIHSNDKTTICFSIITKNNEENILKILENIYKYINYFVIIDRGSTDNTCGIIRSFFNDKNILGELFEYNMENYKDMKNILFEKAYNKTDFILFQNVNEELIIDDLKLNDLNVNKSIGYEINIINNNNIINKKCLFYNNRYIWKFKGIMDDFTEPISECINNCKNLQLSYISDKNLYIKMNLSIDNCNSIYNYDSNTNDLLEYYNNNYMYFTDFEYSDCVYLIADRYFAFKKYDDALLWFSIYNKFRKYTKEKLFISFLKTAICLIHKDYPIKYIIYNIKNSISIFVDRAEPYIVLANYFINKHNFELAYFNLKKVKNINYTDVINKYTLFINKNNYGLNINFILAYVCYNSERLAEAITLLNELDEKITNNFNEEKIIIDNIISPTNEIKDNNDFYILVNKIMINRNE